MIKLNRNNFYIKIQDKVCNGLTLYFLIILCSIKSVYSQITTKNEIKLEINIEEKILFVNQKIILKNLYLNHKDTLYLSDWSNSYSGGRVLHHLWSR